MEATKFNNPIAEEIVGLCYLGGYGVETDYTKAQEWFLKSEIHGSKNRSEHEKLLEKFKNKNIVKQSGKTENKENPVEESNKQPDYKLKPTSYNDDDYVDFSGCKYKPAADTGISFDDIIGMDEAKNEVMNLIVLPTKYPELYAKFKKKSGGGILLYGLPATGKTMFVQAVATEINAKFFNIKCSDIISKWVGESEENIKELFDTARKCKRAIIFFDEFDSLGKERSSAENDHHNTVVNELLAQIQGFEKNKNTILLLAASNRPWDIDSALLRPGRFNRKIYIPLPDRETRIAIVKKQLTSVPVSDGIDYEEIGDFTDGFNCSDVVELCEQMKMNAITRAIRENSSNQTIKNDDVEYAKRKVRSSVTENDRMKIKEFERYSL